MVAEQGNRWGQMIDVGRRQPWSVWSGVGVATVLAMLAAGGLNPTTVVATDVDPLELGVAVDTGPFDITIDRVRAVDELPGISEGDEATRVIAMVATVSITQSTTQGGYLLNDSLTLSGVPGLVSYDDSADDGAIAPTDSFVMADGTRLDALQPGLEYEVAIVWEQETTQPTPTEVEVELVGYTLRESSIDHSQEWLDPAPIRAGEVVVTEPTDDAGDQG